MSDIKLDSTGDIEIVNNVVDLVTGVDARVQHLNIRFRLFRGEYFLNRDAGIPYYQQILKKQPDKAILDSIFQQAILETPGVTALESFDLQFDGLTRQLTLDFRAQSVDGEINFVEEEI